MDPGRLSFAAVILAGGTAARLDGVDKAALVHDGTTFLERALAATLEATEVVVVGEQVPTSRPVTFVREEPSFGGPVAGLVAGRRALAGHPAALLVLAVDMPLVTASTLRRLRARLADAGGGDGAALTDRDGRRRLVLLLRTEALDAAIPDVPHGRSVGSLLARLDLVDVVAEDHEARGIDTPADLRDLPDLRDGRTGAGDGVAGRPRSRDAGPVNLHDWIDELCDVLDVETDVDEALVLDLARSAAHDVTKVAAPISTYLLGFAAGAQGAGPDDIERLAAQAQALAEGWDRPADARDPVDIDDEVPDDSAVDHTNDAYEQA